MVTVCGMSCIQRAKCQMDPKPKYTKDRMSRKSHNLFQYEIDMLDGTAQCVSVADKTQAQGRKDVPRDLDDNGSP